LVLLSIVTATAFYLFNQKELPDSVVTGLSTIPQVQNKPQATESPSLKSEKIETRHESGNYESQLAAILDKMPTLNNQLPPRADEFNAIHGFQADEFAEGHKLAELRK